MPPVCRSPAGCRSYLGAVTSTAVVFGGPSPEHDISILTGLQAARLLAQGGAAPICLYWTKTGDWVRVSADLEAAAFTEPTVPGSTPVELTVPGGFSEKGRLRAKQLEIDVVLNCCHGGPGEDGSLTALLQLAGLRVTGPHPEASALAMDKLATAATAAALGVPTMTTVPVTGSTKEIALDAPWVVKPRFGGSSIGIQVGVEDVETARALAAKGAFVAQRYLDGWHDVNVSVRAHPQIQVSPAEKPARTGGAIYDYRAKYLGGRDGMESAQRELPAVLPPAIREEIERCAEVLLLGFGLGGVPRIDFLWDGADGLVFCEVNSIPGALGLYLWDAAGVPRVQVLRDMIAEALAGPVRRPHWAATSDGSALRVAGNIASKLV
jgi:D-alanine-D-alanine ligase